MPSTDYPASDAGQLCRAEFAGPLREQDQIQIASGAFYLCQHSRLHATYPTEMVDRRIGGLPVVDTARKVVGVVTETDIFRAFVEMQAGATGATQRSC